MTTKELAAAVGAGAALTAAVALATLSEPDAPCWRQTVQVPAEDYGKEGGLVTVVVERVGSQDDPLPEGWDAVTKPEPVECGTVDAKTQALAWVPEAKYGFAATLPASVGLDGKTVPARSVVCPPPPYVLGHEPEGCAEEWGRLEKLKAPQVVEMIP